MPNDELTKPLGLSPRPAPPRLPVRRIAAIAVAAIALSALGGGVWWSQSASHAQPPPKIAAATPAKPTPRPLPDTSSVTGAISPTNLAASNAPSPASSGPGLTDLQPTGSLTDAGKVVIFDPSLPPPIALPATPNATVTEAGSYGPLPKVAANGVRPLDVYARPAQDDGGARIAIVIGGVGIDPDTTASAIALPGQVTLAVAPYGTNLPQTLSDARAAGHELLLQIPLEPFGYPQTNPGPHTLTVAASAKVNLDNLNWLLARTTNYVGVINYMGARFTSDSPSMTTLLTAVGQRGLLYLDDGSSPRSLAADVAQGKAPFLAADLVLDPDLNPAAIDARLDQLVGIARQRGYAIATASAFPATIDRIAAFAKAAAAKDISLVPVSELVATPHS